MLLKKYSCYFASILLLSFWHLSAFANQKAEEAEVAYKHATELQKAARYEEAILEFQEIERLFPYSKFAKSSKLNIADIHFEMTNYIQAQYQYQHYYDLYPSDSKSSYALFKIGESLYKQMPRTVDRDLSQTGNVLKVWRNVLVRFPKSEYAKTVLERQKELIEKLGKKELYIAEYYKKQKKYISAHRRYQGLFKQFPNFKKNQKALEGAIETAKQVEDEPQAKKYAAWLADI